MAGYHPIQNVSSFIFKAFNKLPFILGGVALFVIIFPIVIIVDSVHTINEGMVGIYFIHGALDDRVCQLLSILLLPFDVKKTIISVKTSLL